MEQSRHELKITMESKEVQTNPAMNMYSAITLDLVNEANSMAYERNMSRLSSIWKVYSSPVFATNLKLAGDQLQCLRNFVNHE